MPAIPETPELYAWKEEVDQAPPPVMGASVLQQYGQADHLMGRARQMHEAGSPIGGQVAQSLAQERLGEADAELFSIQDRLKKLDTDQRAKLNTYLGQTPLLRPDLIRLPDHVAVLVEHPTQLRRFLNWHVKHLAEQQQDPLFHKAVEEHKQRYLQAIDWAEQHRWLSSSMLSGSDAVLNARVVIGDLWDTILRGWAGYQVPGSPNIVIAQSMHSDPKIRAKELDAKLDHEAAHEYVHLELDGEDSWLSRWMREGRAEHIKLALRDRTDQSFSVTDPLERKRQGLYEKRSYVDERQLIATLLDAGSESIDPRLFTLGVSSNGPNNVSWTALEQALDYSWGTRNMIGWVNKRVEEQEEHIRSQHEKAVAANPKVEPKTNRNIQEEALAAVRGELLDLAKLRNARTPQQVGARVLAGIK
jgi:hypothetical protein